MDYRIENKRLLKGTSHKEVIAELKKNKFLLNRSYIVHSLYLDDWALKSYTDHIDGYFMRSKFRIRCYTNEQGKLTNSIFFEIKNKEGQKGSKARSILSTQGVTQSVNIKNCLEMLLEHALSRGLSSVGDFEVPKRLFPVCYISYKRKRFNNAKSNTEFNIDTQVSATKISRNLQVGRTIYLKPAILEEKYEKFDNSNRALIERINLLSYPEAFSKYVWAVENLF